MATIDLAALSTAALLAALADVERHVQTAEARFSPNNDAKRRAVDAGVAIAGELWRRGFAFSDPTKELTHD